MGVHVQCHVYIGMAKQFLYFLGCCAERKQVTRIRVTESVKMKTFKAFKSLSDNCMEAAYSILKDKKVADGVRVIIIPGTMQIYRECVERGFVTAFIDAGAIVSTPTCGPCLGGYMGILAAGEKCIATTNRNFVGRMGHVDSEVYLASPHTAAASALTGYITEYKEA